MNAIVLMLLRQGLKAGGLALFSDSQVEQAAGAISLLAGLAWSGVNAYREHAATQSSVPTTPKP